MDAIVNDDRNRNPDLLALVEHSRELCSTARATVASAKAGLARSKQLREGIPPDDRGDAADGNVKRQR